MRIALFMLAALLAGCGSWPKNADEFRDRATKGPSNLIDTFEVSRPLADVATALRKKSTECLNVSLKLRTRLSDAGTITFKPTFVSHANHVEVHVQRKTEGTREVTVGDLPPDGAYRVVLDATPISASRTKIVIYRMTFRGTDDVIRDGLVHWAKGDNMGCPVLGIM